ncbi:endonuclease VII [Enterobacter phage Arya]|uniref:Rho termination factor-like N-terminal domain-containing protein n=1 Tax=Enterobacter phage Arya TaxID=1864622 RepID=A0A193GYL0_9CAUD|nr:endonuclease VII [Enterobacter phage Arya]ANN86114.1 hypothetical protein BI096_gp06 [Enterobacter phage Arya]
MKSVLLKLTSAIVIAGSIAKAGEVVEVTELEAKNLLARGKGVLNDEQPADEVDLDLSKKTKDQLLEIADNLEIEGAAKMNKAQLIEAIEAADNGQEEETE